MLPGVGIVGIDDSTCQFIKKLQDGYFTVHGICGTQNDLRYLNQESLNVNMVTTRIEELLINSEINLIVFTRIGDQYSDHIRKTLAVAGKHVLCLRMLAMSEKHARDMYEASLKYSVLFSAIVNPYRYINNFLTIKKLLDQTVVGQLKYIDISIRIGPQEKSKFEDDSYFNASIFQRYSIYLIDAFIFILNKPIKTVQANFRHLQLAPDTKPTYKQTYFDDYSNFYGRFEDDTLINITGRMVRHNFPYNYHHFIEIIGTEGIIKLDNDVISCFSDTSTDKYSEILQGYNLEPIDEPYSPYSPDCYDKIIDELKKIFSTGKYNPQMNMINRLIKFEEAIALREIVDAAYESNSTGSMIFIVKKKPRTEKNIDNNQYYDFKRRPSESTQNLKSMNRKTLPR